jgi:hypothetical protein
VIRQPIAPVTSRPSWRAKRVPGRIGFRRAESLGARSLVSGLLFLAGGAAISAGVVEPPRAARSVHLGYPAAEGDLFYNEVTGGKPLRGYYSFIEDFRRDGRSANELRRARFGNGWVRSTRGEWISLDRANFTASSAEWEAKENIDAGVAQGRYYLATGGNTARTRELGKWIELPAFPSAHPPELPDPLKP